MRDQLLRDEPLLRDQLNLLGSLSTSSQVMSDEAIPAGAGAGGVFDDY
jgi:hypothetical protein